MKKVMTKIVSVVLTVVMLLSAAPLSGLVGLELPQLFSFKSEALTSGDFTYTVSGSNATITGYSGTATNLTIPSTLGGYKVVNIGDGAFKDNTKIISVIIPSTVININNNAFMNCKKLQYVTFTKGSSNATIGRSAFKNCPSLQSVSLPGNYTNIGKEAFYGCISMTTFVLEKSAYTYANQLISDYAFNGCTNLSSISLPTTLKSIGNSAFENCTSLKNVVIPEGVTSIGGAAFKGCTKITSLSLPSTLTIIDNGGFNNNGAFQNCNKLKTVTFAKGSSNATIDSYAFAGCSALESVYLPGNYALIEREAFKDCASLTSFKWEKSDYTYANQFINYNAFSDCTSLSSLSLPSTLESIAIGAFRNCISLTDVVIPEGVKAISDGAFEGCTNLRTLSLPSTLTVIGNENTTSGAFMNCTSLKKINFAEGEGDIIIGNYTFSGCSALESVYLPGNYAMLGREAFKNCTSLTSFEWEKSSYVYANQSIDSYAFYGCTNLSRISLPTTLKSIGFRVYEDCTSLETVTIPEGVTTIGNGAFRDCTKLTNLSLPSTIIEIGDDVFRNCTALKQVIVAEGEDDLTIGAYAFMNCSSLTTVHIPMNTFSINTNAFKNSNSNLTLCSSSSSSYAKTFASSNGLKFRVCTSHEEIKPDMPKYTVTYNANGGSVSPTSSLVEKDSSTTLPTPTKSYTVIFNANGGSNAPASLKASLTCKGWSTSASATSATYSCGSSFTPAGNTTLYAVWNTSASFNVPVSEPTRDGYEFLGWAASNSSTTASIHAGDRVNVSGNATYYAVWKEIPSLTVSQIELTLDLDNVDTGFATVTVNRPSNEALTLEASSSSTSVAMVELGDYDSTDDTCPATFIVKGVGTCTVTFKLYSADKSVLYDTETVTINVKQDATKQIGMNYNGVTVIDDFDGVYFESLNPDVATVDDNGKITATGRGTAIILVTDIDGNISYYSITVNFSFFQWIIYILFFGWLWY
ncbi:MAG: leucine-rich repeat protein [Clostridia bacterium]|nr:leucine-rich repeat protein [Clostridia bacterium]